MKTPSVTIYCDPPLVMVEDKEKEKTKDGEYMEEKRKLEVMVKIFGRKTPLELSYMQVEKL